MAHSLLPPVKLVLLGSSLGFFVPGPSCTWAGVSSILFADSNLSPPDSHPEGIPQHTPVTSTLVLGPGNS